MINSVFAVTGIISISAYAFIIDNYIGIGSSVAGLKVFITTGGIEKYMSIIKKKIKKHSKIVFLAKCLNS